MRGRFNADGRFGLGGFTCIHCGKFSDRNIFCRRHLHPLKHKIVVVSSVDNKIIVDEAQAIKIK